MWCSRPEPDPAAERSGAERKLTVDRDGAIKLLEAAEAADVPRYLMISSVGAEDPPEGDDVFSVYLRAKAEADAAVQSSGREWTIVRPGRLTDEPGSGRVRIDLEPFRGEIPRDDVAAVLDAVLQDPRAAHRTLYVNAGTPPSRWRLRRFSEAPETALGLLLRDVAVGGGDLTVYVRLVPGSGCRLSQRLVLGTPNVLRPAPLLF